MTGVPTKVGRPNPQPQVSIRGLSSARLIWSGRLLSFFRRTFTSAQREGEYYDVSRQIFWAAIFDGVPPPECISSAHRTLRLETLEDRWVLSAGSLDTSFANGWHAGFGSELSANATQAQNVAVESNGKILAAGGGSNSFTMEQLNADGSLDTTYGNSGVATIGLVAQATETVIRDVLSVPDGSAIVLGTLVGPFGPPIMLAGGTMTSSSVGSEAFMASVTANGQLNTAFGNGAGYVVFPGNGNSVITFGFLTADGKIDIQGSMVGSAAQSSRR